MNFACHSRKPWQHYILNYLKCWLLLVHIYQSIYGYYMRNKIPDTLQFIKCICYVVRIMTIQYNSPSSSAAQMVVSTAQHTLVMVNK